MRRGVVLWRSLGRDSVWDELLLPQLEAAEVHTDVLERDVGDGEEGLVAGRGQRQVDGHVGGHPRGRDVEVVALLATN